MKSNPNYKRATNMAYQLLIKRSAFSPSTNVFAIAEDLLEKCKLLTYSQACFFYGYTPEQLLEVSEYGFSIVSKKKRVILYNETVPLGCIRLTIAHEIGHAVLGHDEEHDPAAEKEANCFARNLLCPLPVADGLDILTVDDYIALFDVSEKMVGVSLEWRESDRFYLAKIFMILFLICLMHICWESMTSTSITADIMFPD